MQTSVEFCKAGQWAVQNIQRELEEVGIEYQFYYDDSTKCGGFVVTDSDAEAVSKIVMEYTELRGG